MGRDQLSKPTWTTVGRRMIAAAGPGLVVMLADTEAGSVITAAQSGARWGYALLLPQFLLIPGMYMAQELAARLGVATGRGLIDLVRRRGARRFGWLLGATLAVSCLGAMLTELSGLAGVAQSFGVPLWQAVAAAVSLVLILLWSRSYRTVERAALAIGVCELAFLALAWRAQPDPRQVFVEAVHVPLGDPSFLYLLAANLGTSVIPWAIFYQQSASCSKGLRRRDLVAARLETLAGSILCQCITAGILIAAAARLRSAPNGAPLATIAQIADAFTASLGQTAGHAVFALGLGGGALTAMIVVCQTAGWAAADLLGARDTTRFNAAVTAALVAGGGVIASGADLVQLSIGAGVMNALLLPVVLWTLFRLARDTPPPGLRLRGVYAAVAAMVFALIGAVGLCSGLMGGL